jgi:hypothetical protein
MTTTRRAALGALASASVLALPAAAGAATMPAGAHIDPGSSLATLGAEFEEAWAAERRIVDDGDDDDERFGRGIQSHRTDRAGDHEHESDQPCRPPRESSCGTLVLFWRP